MVGDTVPSWQAGEILRLFPLTHLIVSYQCFPLGGGREPSDMGAWKFTPTPPEQKREEWTGMQMGPRTDKVFCTVCLKMQKVLLILSVGSEVGILIWFIRKDLASVEGTRFQIGPVLRRITQLNDD